MTQTFSIVNKEKQQRKKTPMIPNPWGRGNVINPEVTAHRIFIGEQLLAADQNTRKTLARVFQINGPERTDYMQIATVFGSKSPYDPLYVRVTPWKILELIAQRWIDHRIQYMIATLVIHWIKEFSETGHRCDNGIAPTVEEITYAIEPINAHNIEIRFAKYLDEVNLPLPEGFPESFMDYRFSEIPEWLEKSFYTEDLDGEPPAEQTTTLQTIQDEEDHHTEIQKLPLNSTKTAWQEMAEATFVSIEGHVQTTVERVIREVLDRKMPSVYDHVVNAVHSVYTEDKDTICAIHEELEKAHRQIEELLDQNSRLTNTIEAMKRKQSDLLEAIAMVREVSDTLNIIDVSASVEQKLEVEDEA